jgi:hypothetical protein
MEEEQWNNGSRRMLFSSRGLCVPKKPVLKSGHRYMGPRRDSVECSYGVIMSQWQVRDARPPHAVGGRGRSRGTIDVLRKSRSIWIGGYTPINGFGFFLKLPNAVFGTKK